MKTKFLQAFEEMEQIVDQTVDQTPPVVCTTELVAEISSIDSDVNDVVCDLKEINEASAISDSVDCVADTMQTSVEKEEGLDEPSMALADTAMEHFFQRLNFKDKKVRPSLAVENFSDSSKRLTNTKIALENLNSFRGSLKRSLLVCQESFGDSVNARFSKSNNQLEAVLSAADQVSVEFDKKGASAKNFPSGQWSKSLGVFSKNPVLGKDVLERVKKVKQTFEGIGIVSFMNDLCTSADKIVEELGKENSEIKGDDALDKRLSAFNSKAEELHDLLIAKGSDGGGGSEFVPLTKEEKNELISLVSAIGNELGQFSKGWKKLNGKIDEVKKAAEKAEDTKNVEGKRGDRSISGRLTGAVLGTMLGFMLIPIPFFGTLLGYGVGSLLDKRTGGTPGQSESAYKKQASDAKQKTDDTLQNIIEIDGELVKFCFSIVSHVEKSTK